MVANTNKVAGLLYGSYVADSLALAAHWIYDQDELQRTVGRVTELLDPRDDSYHPTKKRGQQTHYGDQALTLMDSITANRGFAVDQFAEDWQRMWDAYSGYRDHATKETLKHLRAGLPPAEAASHSNELGGAVRIAPLVALMADAPADMIVAAARNQTAITHSAKITGDAAEFIARMTAALLRGATLREALEEAFAANYDELDPADLRTRVEAVRSLDIKAAAKALGLACPAPQALPTLLLILERLGDNLEHALIENVMAGGDNASRGLALGMILGATHGKTAIPTRWIEPLEAAPRIETFLTALESN
jgi:ADP-ribosylglycohydrolase